MDIEDAVLPNSDKTMPLKTDCFKNISAIAFIYTFNILIPTLLNDNHSSAPKRRSGPSTPPPKSIQIVAKNRAQQNDLPTTPCSKAQGINFQGSFRYYSLADSDMDSKQGPSIRTREHFRIVTRFCSPGRLHYSCHTDAANVLLIAAY